MLARSALLGVALTLVLSGCTGAPDDGVAAGAAGSVESPGEESAATEQTPATPVPQTIQADEPMHPESVVQAIADLEARLGTTDPVELVEHEAVTWPDGALGCPQPGMMVTQALVPGYRIRLRSGNRLYNYHGRAGGAPRYCERPQAAQNPHALQ